MLDRRITIALCVIVGVTLEIGTGTLSGRREAWDSREYWTIGLPFAAVAALAIGCLSRRRDWVWAILIVPSQMTAMMLRNSEVGALWPLTMVIASVLSLPFVLLSWAGARLSRSRAS